MWKTVSHASATLLVVLLASCSSDAPSKSVAPPGNWSSLFDGKDLAGWTPKIAGHMAGEDPAKTFRVENGVLKVAYTDYTDFGQQIGMLVYDKPLSRYWLRVEYRFIGNPAPGAPEWAYRDSGIQFHGQAIGTIGKDQQFPVCVEINLIGGKPWSRSRPTGNVCTNGTHVSLDGIVMKDKCSTVSAKTIRNDDWTLLEAKIDGSANVEHWINGQSIVRYTDLKLDETFKDAQALIALGAQSSLASGYLSLQSNGAPIEFRKIEVLPLEP